MKPGRLVIAMILPVALFAGVCLAQQKPKTFSEEFRAAASNVQRKRFPEAIKALDALLTKYKDPVEVKQLRLARAECLHQMTKYDDALTELNKLMADFKTDKDLQSAALLGVGDAHRAKKEFDKAVAAYQQVAKDHADQPERAADALLKAGGVLCDDMKKLPEGLASYAAVETQFPTLTRQAADSVLKMAVVQETLTKDSLNAGAAYQKLAEKYGSLYQEHVLAGYFAKAGACYLAAQKVPQALAILKKGEQALTDSRQKTPLALTQVQILMQDKKYPEARTECERIICEYPLELDVCQTAQTLMVEAFRTESKFNEALGAARILYDAAAGEQSIRAAAHVVAQAFRSVDSNLARANEFLSYQRFGPDGPDGKPNTPDDVRVNHLLAVKHLPPNAVRDKRFAAAVQAQPDMYEGYRARGFLYAYWGKPKESAQQLRLAFKVCPDATVPAAAHELVLVGIKAYRASFFGLEKVFEYISYGPKGKSGKENIPDPFQGL